MPSFTGKTFSNFYKNLLGINQSGNTGVDATTRNLQDGAGNSSAISLSDDVLSVQPVNDDTTGAMLVKNNAGNNILAVDTTNSKVLVGASQVAANTQYAHFAIDNDAAAGWIADQHYMVPFGGAGSYDAFSKSTGSATSSTFNDTDPATGAGVSISSTTTVINAFWYVIDNITIDAVHWFHGSDSSGTGSTAAHLMSYTVDTDNGVTGGDLSSPTVLADGAVITNEGYEQAYYQSMTIQSADVDAGKVIIFTFAQTTMGDYNINAQVKYHIR